MLLNGLGLVLIYRLDLEPSLGPRAAPTQLVWSTLGVGLFIAGRAGAARPPGAGQRTRTSSVTAALALLVAPIFFPAVNGARIWIRVAGFSFQPGEFAKVLLAVFFAGYLSANRAALAYTGRRVFGLRFLQLPTGRVLGPVLAIWLVSVGVLVLERDLGTSLLFFGLFVVMLYVATGRNGLDRGRAAARGGRRRGGEPTEPHVHARVQDWLHPFATIDAGRRPEPDRPVAVRLRGRRRRSAPGSARATPYLIGFAAKSDFVLATAGEELGLCRAVRAAGCCTRCWWRAASGPGWPLRDPFGRLLAVGLASILALQVFVITGGVMDLIPLTGMAMPFLAQGGSSVVTNWIIVALLIRISDRARRPEPAPGRTLPGAAGDAAA